MRAQLVVSALAIVVGGVSIYFALDYGVIESATDFLLALAGIVGLGGYTMKAAKNGT